MIAIIWWRYLILEHFGSNWYKLQHVLGCRVLRPESLCMEGQTSLAATRKISLRSQAAHFKIAQRWISEDHFVLLLVFMLSFIITYCFPQPPQCIIDYLSIDIYTLYHITLSQANSFTNIKSCMLHFNNSNFILTKNTLTSFWNKI